MLDSLRSFLPYVLMTLMIGLGVLIICRPKPAPRKAEK
jgi:hypothetical protein